MNHFRILLGCDLWTDENGDPIDESIYNHPAVQALEELKADWISRCMIQSYFEGVTLWSPLESEELVSKLNEALQQEVYVTEVFKLVYEK